MTETVEFDYKGENSNNYKIIIETTKEEDLFLSIVDLKSRDVYSSNYYLTNLNEKFLNVNKFKKIIDFKSNLVDNIKSKSLILKAPYKNVINSVWKVFPSDKSKNQTFTLISSKSSNKKISIYSYSNFSKIKNIIEEIKQQLSIEINKNSLQLKEQFIDKITFENNSYLDNIYCLTGNYSSKNEKENDFIKLLESNQTDFGFRKLIIFFDEDDVLDYLIKIVKKFYQNQIFILIFTTKNIENFKLEVKSKLNKLKETYLSYFDFNNIFINEYSSIGYKKSILPILKVYCYFNQLGDGFYKQLLIKNDKIHGLEEETKHLFLTHYFNILLYGRTGVGKSTFINQIMGEKKSFTLKTKSIGTERNNFYIHKDYPIKIIDVCGFAEGNEAKENLEKLNMIYKKESTNILIDEPMNDIFSFYGDKRNNIHLLIYFNVYDDRYDIFPGELPIIYDIEDKHIPIIFVVNKCPDDIFEDEEEKNLLEKEVSSARKDTDFEKYKTYYINCIKGKGFDELLKGIFSQFEKNIIIDADLAKIKDLSMPIENFNKLFEHSFFFGDISPKDVFLNESLIESVLDIKKLITKLAGYYSGELGKLNSLSFYFFNRLYNQIWRNSTKNFFPLLTDLVKKIYLNFGFKKSYEECNNFIKQKVSQYFNLKLEGNEPQNNTQENHNETKKGNETQNNTQENNNKIEKGNVIINVNDKQLPIGNIEQHSQGNDKQHSQENDEPNNIEMDDEPAPYNFSFEQFTKDFTNLVKLYWYAKDNFRTNDKIEESELKKGSNIEEKLFKIEDENIIDPRRLLLLVKRDFGLDNSKRDATAKEKIFQKLFYISYTCNELISLLCGNSSYKEIKYTSIYNFYYTVSLTYNKAINGFLNISQDIQKKQQDLKNYLGEGIDDDAPPVK